MPEESASAVPSERAAEVFAQQLGVEAVSLHSAAGPIVVRPRTVAQVGEALRVARDLGIQVCPSGGQGEIPVASGAVLDLSGLAALVELNAEDMLAVVPAGTRVCEVAAAAGAVGLAYPPAFLEERRTSVGGSLARGDGARGPAYGPAREYVLGLRVVLPSGELVSVGSRAIKHATGYSLTQLLLGSRGALGVIVEATLRLTPKPARTRTLLVGVPDVLSAIGLAAALAGDRLPPAAVELLDRRCLDLGVARASGLLAGRPGAALMVLMEGADEADLEERTGRVVVAAREVRGAAPVVVPDEAEVAVWDARRELPGALGAQSPAAALLELSLPLSASGGIAARIRALAERRRVDVALFGGAGMGALSAALLSAEGGRSAALALCRELAGEALSVGGKVTGARGTGLSYSEWLDLSLASPVGAAIRQIKSALDPSGLLVPGQF